MVSLLRHELLHALLHFGRRDIFFMSRDRPGMTERIFQTAEAISPKHIGRLGFGPGAGGDGLVKDRIHIVDVEEDAARGATQGLGRLAAAAWHFVGEHNFRIADFDFRVADLSVRTVHAHYFFRAECTLVEIESARGVTECEIGCYRVEILRNGFA